MTTTAVTTLEPIDVFTSFGVRAYVTTRAFGSLSTQGDESVQDVIGRWDALRLGVLRAPRFATGRQVHGTRVAMHDGSWSGWLRVDDADGHYAPDRGTGLAVTVADCVPVLIAHPSGAVAALHAGWRGTAAGIMRKALTVMAEDGLALRELRVHLGPAICGKCYEVSPEVYAQLTGKIVESPTTVDLRGLLAGQACAAGVRAVTVSDDCSRCDDDRFFSHRGGDTGRQAAAIIAD
jgi:YfiH family protein